MVRRILLPLDGSEASDAVVDGVADLARQTGAEVVLLTVVEPPSQADWATDAVVSPLEPPRGQAAPDEATLREQAQDHLAAVAQRLRGSGLRLRTVVTTGSPAHEILRAVREQGVDMVAMATHGRTGLAKLLMGSVAEAVVRESPVPVLLWRLRLPSP